MWLAETEDEREKMLPWWGLLRGSMVGCKRIAEACVL